MFVYQPELSNILVWLEVIAALIAIGYYHKIKHTYWKWFVFYLLYIAVIEKFGDPILAFFKIEKASYFAYAGIPIEFEFFFWLYAVKSLKKPKLFWLCTIVYFLSFIPHELFFKKLVTVYSFNYTVGTLLLMILVFLEWYKQIKNDDILLFKENKMFYINIGVMLFYIGTIPFYGLYGLLLKVPEIWNNYYIYFIVSNCMMYLLFSFSFIWGKPKS